MSMKRPPATLGVCVFNEEKTVVNYLKRIKNGLDKLFGKENYELLVVENGSTDKTLGLVRSLKFKELRVIKAGRKGHGLSLKLIIENAKFDRVGLLGLDMPFGFDDLKTATKKWEEYDLIFGSKAHPDSKINSPLKRKVASLILRFILRFFFKSSIKDSQGTLFLRKSKVLPILDYANSETAFFTVQLSLYCSVFGLKLLEIPVKMMKSKGDRVSKYRVLRDGSRMLYDLFREYWKFNKIYSERYKEYEHQTTV